MGRKVNTDENLDQVFSFLGYFVVASMVVFLAALLVVVLPIAFIADKQSQLRKAPEELRRRRR